MKTDADNLEQLQLLLATEKNAREAVEARLAQKELELQFLLKQQANKKSNNAGIKEKTRDASLFRDVINNLPGIVFQVQKNNEGIFVFNFVSPVLHQMFGFQVTDTNQVLPFIHPEDREKWTQSLETTYKSIKTLKLEIRFLLPTGILYWYISATPSYSEIGELLYNGILLNITGQKEAELNLKESEKKWRFALEGSGDGLWEYNALTHTTFYSSIFKEMLGYNEEEYANDPNFWRKSIHPSDLSIVEQMEKNYDAGIAESHSIQYRARNKSGKYVWIMDRGFVLSKDNNNKPTHYIGVHTNISEIKNIQLELASTATKLATLVTNMQDGIILEDENNVIILCNQAFCEIFKIPMAPKEIVGENIEAALKRNPHHFIDPDLYILRRQSLISECKAAFNEEIELANGIFLSRDYAPLIIDGHCKGHLWKYTNITQRKRAQKELISAERRYRSLIENMQVGLVEFDLQQNILYANYTFYNMCGYNKEELNGKLGKLLFVDKPEVAEQKSALRKAGISDAYEIEILTKSGERKWWYISGAPRQNDNLETIATIGACLDISDQKKLEYELRNAKLAAEQSANAKDVFLANMSHEIRTPMNAIFGMLRLMGKTDLLPKQRFYLDTISNSTSMLMVIVNDILDFSRISAGKLSLERKGFYLADVINSSLDIVANSAQEKGLQLIINYIGDDNNILLGDPFRLKQVFINLMTNAVKFTTKGSVTINCKNNGLQNDLYHFTIQVKDTGRGMKEDFLKIMFEKFTQEDESIARSYSGTGLGMSISKHLVELMGGNIDVESVKNAGTTFTLDFYFPKGETSDILMDEVMEIDILLLENKLILLVEDNEMNQLVAKTLLEHNGIKVQVAENGLVAIRMIKETDFDLVLMDMQMPVMDGLQATTIIRKTNKALPIIALTANALEGERNKCIDAGMNDFLAKPFNENVLLGLLCKWINKTPNQNMALTQNKNNTIKSHVVEAEPALYNLDQLRAISAGNNELLKMFVKAFLDEAKITIGKMGTALEQNDLKEIKSLAHRIKPSIDQMNIPFNGQIKRIEVLCLAENKTQELNTLVNEFKDLINNLIPLLEKEL